MGFAAVGCSSGEDTAAPRPTDTSDPVASGVDFIENDGSSTVGSSAAVELEDDAAADEVQDNDREVNGSTSGDAAGDDDADTSVVEGSEVAQVPADEVETIGSPPPTFVYTEEVEPAESLAATLCNLNAPYLRTLRSEDAKGDPIVDDDLRLGVLSLSDSVSLWEDLKISFPAATTDIDTAERVRTLWANALAAQADSDSDEAASLMIDADEQIDLLPEVGPEEIEACIS